MTSSRLYLAEGIILKRKNIGETDRTLTVFTRQYGKIHLLAKGVRKITSRRSGHIEVFHRSSLTIRVGSGIDTLCEASTINAYQTLISDITSVSYAYYACELVDRLTPDRQKQEEVFELLAAVLSALEHAQTIAKRNAVMTSFALSLLRVLGFLPYDKDIAPSGITPFVERIIERKLRVPRVMRLLGNG